MKSRYLITITKLRFGAALVCILQQISDESPLKLCADSPTLLPHPIQVNRPQPYRGQREGRQQYMNTEAAAHPSSTRTVSAYRNPKMHLLIYIDTTHAYSLEHHGRQGGG